MNLRHYLSGVQEMIQGFDSFLSANLPPSLPNVYLPCSSSSHWEGRAAVTGLVVPAQWHHPCTWCRSSGWQEHSAVAAWGRYEKRLILLPPFFGGKRIHMSVAKKEETSPSVCCPFTIHCHSPGYRIGQVCLWTSSLPMLPSYVQWLVYVIINF